MSHPMPTTPQADAVAQTSFVTAARPPLPITSASVSTHAVTGIDPVESPAGTPAAMADTVAGDVASAMANAQARYTSHQATPWAALAWTSARR
jgi:hypothetical protein